MLNVAVNVTSTVFRSNSAVWYYGGAAYLYMSDSNFLSSEFHSNMALQSGGGLFSYKGSVSFDRCSGTNNVATWGTAGVSSACPSLLYLCLLLLAFPLFEL